MNQPALPSSTPDRRSVERLALGSVQFGLPYGIANAAGLMEFGDVCQILGRARAAGLDTLDTAVAYGVSEARLGEAGVSEWRVFSKLPQVPDGCRDVGRWLEESLTESLNRLRLSCLCGMLLHRPADLLQENGTELMRALENVKKRGLVEKIGASVYSPDELALLMPTFDFDVVQAPFNIFDRHLATSGWLGRLKDAGVEVHVRSVFLQGLLLMSQTARPTRFARWESMWAQWHAWLVETNLTPLAACLGFVLAHSEIDRVVIGVDSVAQLGQIVDAVSGDAAASVRPPDTLASDDVNLINPSRWPVFS